jgi:hypothetical protein
MRGRWLHRHAHARLRTLFFLALLSAGSIACSKRNAAPDQQSSSYDHVNSRALPEAKHFLHRTFAVRDYQAFPIEVPAGVARAKVHGRFQSSVKSAGVETVSDETTAVELLLMNPSQYDDFTHRRSAESTYAVEPAFIQDVDIDMPPTRADPVTYYLVFRNSPDSPTRSVQADFTLSFE